MRHSLEALNDQALLSQFGDLLRQDHEGNANLLRHISMLRKLPTRTTAERAPAPPAPTCASAAPALPAPTSASPAPRVPSVPSVPLASIPMPLPRRSPDPAPLSPGRYKLQVTLNENARNKLKQLQDLLAHQIPNGDPAAIVERALDALLTQVYKRKAGITNKPRAQKPKTESSATTATANTATANTATANTATASANTTGTTTARRTRYIRVAVRRDVWIRDEERCGFIGQDGHRCNETRGLQFAHGHPWGKGGANTAINLGLRCIAHNAWEANRDYGATRMVGPRNRKPLNVREPIARHTYAAGLAL